MRRRAALAAVLAATLPGGHVRAGGAGVTIDNFVFTPGDLIVPAGTRVEWTNHDDIPHSVVSAATPPLFKSPVLDTDEAFARVFDTPGRHGYFCGLHPHMKGIIVVT